MSRTFTTEELILLARLELQGGDVDWRAVALDSLQQLAAIEKLADGKPYSLERDQLDKAIGQGEYTIDTETDCYGDTKYRIDVRGIYDSQAWQHDLRGAVVQAIRAKAAKTRKNRPTPELEPEALDELANEIEASL